MKILYGMFFFILISFFVDCHPAYKRSRKQRMSFELCVEGIECEFCAQSVIDILKKYHSEDIHFVNVADYAHSPLCFIWISKQKNLDIVGLKKDIEREGFDFVSIKGRFYGRASEQDNSFLFDDLVLLATIQERTKKISFNKSIALVGTLSFDAATDSYWLRL